MSVGERLLCGSSRAPAVLREAGTRKGAAGSVTRLQTEDGAKLHANNSETPITWDYALNTSRNAVSRSLCPFRAPTTAPSMLSGRSLHLAESRVDAVLLFDTGYSRSTEVSTTFLLLHAAKQP